MSYYDIDAILTDAQKIPCTFEIDIPGLGYLEGNPGSNIKKGAKAELPLWLGEMLAVSRTSSSPSSITLDLPSALSNQVLNALKADPKSVDIRHQAAHFYALGSRMLDLFEDDDLADVLTESFRKRAREIADLAAHSNASSVGGGGGDYLNWLDEQERLVFRPTHETSVAVKAWMAELKRS